LIAFQFSQTLDFILKKKSKEGLTVKACWSEAAISENKSSDNDNRSAAKDLKVDSNFCKGLYVVLTQNLAYSKECS
jgi:hypothetical protein